MKFNTKKGGPTAGSERKSMKMEADELMEKIKGCVKEALEEQKAEGEGGDEGDPAVEAAPADIAAIIEQAMDVVKDLLYFEPMMLEIWLTGMVDASVSPSLSFWSDIPY